MKEIIDFLSELGENNNREWFNTNKDRYKKVQSQFNIFTQELIERIAQFDPPIGGLSIADCTYRIYRDTRFSHNKIPYKTHIGAYICQGGKKSGYAGYYFHLEPGRSLLATGLHCPEPNVVKSVREEIFTDGAGFAAAASCEGWSLDESSKLKRPPRGYAADNAYVEYLKLKEFDLIKPIDDTRADLLDHITAEFSSCKPFNDILNRAVGYALENPNLL